MNAANAAVSAVGMLRCMILIRGLLGACRRRLIPRAVDADETRCAPFSCAGESECA
jgi:hypothetical protein